MELVLKAGSQTWKTGIMLIALAWSMKHRPGTKLWMTADDGLSKDISDRIIPTLERCPDVAGLILPGRIGKTLYKVRTMLSSLDISGAKSSSSLDQNPYAEEFADECRLWGEGRLQKLKMRQRSYRELAKRALFSTPDLLGDEFDEEFLIGSQGEQLFPCQGCDDLIPLVWSSQYSQLPEEVRVKSQMIFPKGTREVWLECHCNHRHLDVPETRRWILDHGIWQVMNVSPEPEIHDPTVASFHWPAMLNPKVVWFDLVKLYRKAIKMRQDHGITEDLKIFVNESLGESWDESQQFESGEFQPGKYAIEEAVAQRWDHIFMWVDVQLHDFWHVVRGFKLDGSSRLLSEGKLLTWGDIIDKQEKLHVGGLSKDRQGRIGGFVLNSRHVFLDSRWNTDEVHRQCALHNWTAMRGEERSDFRHANGIRRLYSEVRVIACGFDPETKTRLYCGEFLFATWKAEEILQHYLDGKGRPFEQPTEVCVFYHKQLRARIPDFRRNKKTGRDERYWKDIGYREYGPHMRDCEKGILIAAAMEGLVASELVHPKDEADG